MRMAAHSMVLFLLACLCQGCIGVPLPASGTKASCGTRISKEETRFIQAGQTTRDEIIARFGQPFASCEEPEVVAYNWVVISGYWYWMAGTGGPGLFFDRSEIERNEVLLVQLDRDSRVQRFAFRHLPAGQSVKDFLCKWSLEKAPHQKD
jgi:hypothetical protein